MGWLRIAVLCTSSTWAAIGCGNDGDGGAGPGNTEHGPLDNQVVSVVGDAPISLDDVARAAAAQDTDPLDALRELQAIELLAAEATRRGYGERRAIKTRVEQAAVQSLLEAEVEAVITPDSIDGDDLQAEYERGHELERRGSRHLLVRAQESATPTDWSRAQAVARRVLREALKSDDLSGLFERYSGTQQEGFSVLVESIEPVARTAAFEEPYLSALFGAEGTGVLPELARTSYGWHVIELTEIVPEQSLASMADALRARLVLNRRRRRLEALVAQLTGEVDYQEQVIARAFAGHGGAR